VSIDDGADRGAAVPAGLRRYVSGWAVLGTVALAALLASSWPLAWPPTTLGWWVPWLLLVTAATLYLVKIDFDLAADRAEAQSLDELILAASLLLLAPPWPWLVVVLGTLVDEVVSRRDLLKVAFNLGVRSASVGVAVLIHRALAPADPFGAVGLVAMALALCAFFLVNWLAMSGLKLQLGVYTDVRQAVRERLGFQFVSTVTVGAIGVVTAYLLQEAPLLAPLFVAPFVLVRERSLRRQGEERERRVAHRRLEATVAGASDGILLLTATGTVAVWNAALERLSGLPAGEALGQPIGELLRLHPVTDVPAGTEVTHELERPDGTRRTVAVQRSAVELAAGEEGTVVLVRDVSAEAEIALLREDLISRISHELRTPLTSIVGLLATVTDNWDRLEEDRRRQLLARAKEAGSRLTRLVDGLLARGRLDRLGSDPVTEVVALDEVIEQLLDERQGLEGTVQHHRSGARVVADPDHVAQILVVLLDNASTYGEAPFVIATSNGGAVGRLEVRDHGPGVPADFTPRLFDPFAQASTGLRRTARGLGLGLSIASELARANGGALHYRDAPVGASFVLELPCHAGSSHRP
jgi:signal transduction histidine kinase